VKGASLLRARILLSYGVDCHLVFISWLIVVSFLFVFLCLALCKRTFLPSTPCFLGSSHSNCINSTHDHHAPSPFAFLSSRVSLHCPRSLLSFHLYLLRQRTHSRLSVSLFLSSHTPSFFHLTLCVHNSRITDPRSTPTILPPRPLSSPTPSAPFYPTFKHK